MKIQEVKIESDKLQFIKSVQLFYKNDEDWVAPLEKDIAQIFDEKQNLNFKQGKACRWLLFDDKQKIIGRIAAFYSQKDFLPNEKKIGGCGFFECVDSQLAANMLFDTAKQWLQSNGIEGMNGPVNFGEKDKFWGLLVAGFKNPSYQENYNPSYYQKLFENYGFEKLTEQTTSEINLNDFNFVRFNKLASRVLNNPDYSFEHFRIKDLGKFSEDFIAIYNQAWSHRPDFSPMTKDRIETTLKSLKPIILERVMWFAYAHGKPAGFYISVIDVNKIFKPLKGNLNWWGKIKFLWYKSTTKVNRIRGIVFGVIPAYQNLGLETGMIMSLYKAAQKYHPEITASELAWIGDFNPKMHSLFIALGAKTTKIHHTYQIKF